MTFQGSNRWWRMDASDENGDFGDCSPNSTINRKPRMKKIFTLLSDVLKQCNGLGLRKSPPNIITSLEDVNKHLTKIMEGDVFEPQSNAEAYFDLFCIALLEKLKVISSLLTKHSKELKDEFSEYRVRLTKFSMVMHYNSVCLKEMFPESKKYQFITSYEITKKNSAEWWHTSFGADTMFVDMSKFLDEFSKQFPDYDHCNADQLKETIDLSKDQQVTIFEFDVFVRLFYPWDSIYDNWLKIFHHPGYVEMTYDEVRRLLSRHLTVPGSYVFRPSCTKIGQWAIGFVSTERAILQTIPSRTLAQALIEGQHHEYRSARGGCGPTPDLSSLLRRPVPISVSEFDDSEYAQPLEGRDCKICWDKPKNVQFEPCGHLACADCYSKIRRSQQHTPTCPTCRKLIKSFESIVLVDAPSNGVAAGTTDPPPTGLLIDVDGSSQPSSRPNGIDSQATDVVPSTNSQSAARTATNGHATAATANESSDRQSFNAAPLPAAPTNGRRKEKRKSRFRRSSLSTVEPSIGYIVGYNNLSLDAEIDAASVVDTTFEFVPGSEAENGGGVMMVTDWPPQDTRGIVDNLNYEKMGGGRGGEADVGVLVDAGYRREDVEKAIDILGTEDGDKVRKVLEAFCQRRPRLNGLASSSLAPGDANFGSGQSPSPLPIDEADFDFTGE